MTIFGCSPNLPRVGAGAVLTFTLSASLSLLAQQTGSPTVDKARPMDHSQMNQSQMNPDRDQGMNNMKGMPGMSSSDDMNSAGSFLMRESSGTAFQPSAWPMPMLMNQVGDWHLMWMGQAFIVDTQQFGSLRAGDKLY